MGGRRLHPLDLRSLSTDMDSPDEPTVELSRFKTRALCQSVSIPMRGFRNRCSSASPAARAFANRSPNTIKRMGSHRVERVAAQLREEISQIIIRDLKDPRIGMATISEVKLSPDLRNATVKVSVVGEDDARQAAIDGLDHAKGFIRRELGLRLSNLRFAPDLHFQLDEGVAYSVRVSQLLREVQEGEPNAGG